MRRIRNIEALDILIAWNKKNFYRVDLKYRLVLPRREWPGEDGYPCSDTASMPRANFSKEDFLGPEFSSSRDVLTVSAIQSGN
jgi:hypothetical protein